MKKELNFIEKSRHLIQHRAGIVDRNFISDTGSLLKEGEQLKFSFAELNNMCNMVVEAGIKLIDIADEHIAKNRIKA